MTPSDPSVALAAFQRIQSFAAPVRRASWFAACGEALTSAELADAMAYLAALALTAEVSAAATWGEAAATTQRPDWDSAWWEAEERQRDDLARAAAAALGEQPLLAALTAVTQAASDTVLGAAAVAASRAGVADEMLQRVAAGAATQAAYQAALALAVGAGEDHAFAVKFRLFAGGRWPLGIVGGRFFVF
jgi:hypothetical protein